MSDAADDGDERRQQCHDAVTEQREDHADAEGGEHTADHEQHGYEAACPSQDRVASPA